MKTVSSIFILLTIVACSHSKVETKYDNGSIFESYSVNDKKQKDGPYVAYHETGEKREESTYINDTLVGKRTIYFTNGKIEVEEIYTDKGVLDGPYKLYYPTGELQLEKIYSNNVVNGNLKVYYPSGQLKEDVTMVDNEENGPFVEYYQNGAVQWEGTYRKGDKEFGLLIQYDSLGGVIKKMMCDTMATCRTFWKPGMPMINVENVEQ